MTRVDVQQRHAENGAVSGDQRQEDAQQAIERRAGFAHHHFGKLHHHRDNQNKGQRTEIG